MAGRPLRLNGTETRQDSTVDYTLREMNDTEINNGIIYVMLKEFAKLDGTFRVGDLTLAESIGNIATTFIGEWIDTNRTYNVGSRGNIALQTQEFPVGVYQYLTTVPETGMVRPLTYRDGGIRPMTDAEIFTYIIDPALNRMTNYGIGSYFITTGSASDLSSGLSAGTWTFLTAFGDSYRTGTESRTSVVSYAQRPTASVRSFSADTSRNSLGTTTYNIYRKTDETPPSNRVRPLKYANTSQRGKHIVEMTDTDIRTLVNRFRNQIVATTRGTYRFQSARPTGGTWGQRSDTLVDLLNVITQGYYQTGVVYNEVSPITSSFISTYTSSFTGAYVSQTATSQRFFGDGAFQGDSTVSYFASYSGTYFRTSNRSESSVIYKNYQRASVTTSTNIQIGSDTLAENSFVLWTKRSN
jgi:hypothetical protein